MLALSDMVFNFFFEEFKLKNMCKYMKNRSTKIGFTLHLYVKRLHLLIFLLSVCFSQALYSNNSPLSYAQKKLLTIKAENKTMKEIFTTLEKQSEYIFIYYENLIDSKRKYSLDIKNQTIDKILDKLFENTNLSYEINNRQIVIVSKDTDKPTDNSKQETPQKDLSKKIRGRVVDETGSPLPGVIAVIDGSTRGVSIDIDGSFEIGIEDTDKLKFSLLGYQEQEVGITGTSNILVRMVPKVDELSEVTIVAYGTQKKESVIGAITTISPEMLQNSAGKISLSLAGQMAGIVSVQRSGEPGAGADFWIRGISTFSPYNRPLVLVDGIERSLDLVDSEDIESFSILKDATATAVYGVRGANGIILITTKKGREGKFNIKAKIEYGFLSPIRMPKLASGGQWIDYYNDINFDSTGRTVFLESEKQKYMDGSEPDLYPNVNWMKEIYKDITTSQRVNLNITGGSERLRYYVAGSFYNENGIYKAKVGEGYNPSLRFSRYNFRGNIDIDVSPSTTVSVNLSNQYESKNRPGNDNIWEQTLSTTPISTPVIYSDGTLAQSLMTKNPWNILNVSGYSNDFWNTAQSTVSITQDFSEIITKGLRINTKFAWDATNSATLDRRKSPTTYFALGRDEDNKLIFHQNNEGNDYITLNRSNSGSRSVNFEASVTYDNVFFDRHRIGSLFLFNMREYNDNFPINYIASLPNRNQGIAFRATYSYLDKYFIEGNFGYNGSENFAPGKKFGFFPSIASGYLISNEQYFDKIKPYVSLLKLKGSYGEIGNDKIGGNRRFAFNSEMRWMGGYLNGGYIFGSSGQNEISGITTGYPGNSDVSWETAKKTNFGIELELFNKIRINTDFFYEKREGIFIEQQKIPSVVGLNLTEYVNLGKMRNRGVDGSLEYIQHFGDFSLQARANFTFNRNKKLYDDHPTPIWPYRESAGFADRQQRGLVAIGLFESEEDIANSPRQAFGTVRPGDVKYKDINGDGVIDSNDQIAIGYTDVPEINYGIGASLSWKGFDLSVFFQGNGNVTYFIGAAPIYGQENNILYVGQIYSEVADNRWSLKNPDPNAMYPRMSMTWNTNNNQNSTLYQRDVSFIRLKNTEIGYTLPKSLSQKLGLSTVRFYVHAINLLTFSKFKLWDPELYNSSLENLQYGNRYPQMRTISFGVNVNI